MIMYHKLKEYSYVLVMAFDGKLTCAFEQNKTIKIIPKATDYYYYFLARNL